MNPGIYWSPGMTLDNMEKLVIVAALKCFHNNKTQTALALGISIRTLDNKLERYSTEDADQRKRDEDARLAREDFQRRQRGYPGNSPQPPSLQPKSGIHMESAKEASAQHAVPVSERQEVQELPPKLAAGSGAARGRR